MRNSVLDQQDFLLVFFFSSSAQTVSTMTSCWKGLKTHRFSSEKESSNVREESSWVKSKQLVCLLAEKTGMKQGLSFESVKYVPACIFVSSWLVYLNVLSYVLVLVHRPSVFVLIPVRKFIEIWRQLNIAPVAKWLSEIIPEKSRKAEVDIIEFSLIALVYVKAGSLLGTCSCQLRVDFSTPYWDAEVWEQTLRHP